MSNSERGLHFITLVFSAVPVIIPYGFPGNFCTVQPADTNIIFVTSGKSKGGYE